VLTYRKRSHPYRQPAASSCSLDIARGPLSHSTLRGCWHRRCSNPGCGGSLCWPSRARGARPRPPRGRSRTREGSRGRSGGWRPHREGWVRRGCSRTGEAGSSLQQIQSIIDGVSEGQPGPDWRKYLTFTAEVKLLAFPLATRADF
jgi:hypothetical protein